MKVPAHLQQRIPDEKLQNLLAARGYDVPLIVIRLWSRHMGYNNKFSRYAVERWLLWAPGAQGRAPHFPEHLAMFERRICDWRRLQNSLDRSYAVMHTSVHEDDQGISDTGTASEAAGRSYPARASGGVGNQSSTSRRLAVGTANAR